MPISYNLFMYAVLTSYIITSKTVDILYFNLTDKLLVKESIGGVAQMVERSLSMREVPGSIPGASSTFYMSIFKADNYFQQIKYVSLK